VDRPGEPLRPGRDAYRHRHVGPPLSDAGAGPQVEVRSAAHDHRAGRFLQREDALSESVALPPPIMVRRFHDGDATELRRGAARPAGRPLAARAGPHGGQVMAERHPTLLPQLRPGRTRVPRSRHRPDSLRRTPTQLWPPAMSELSCCPADGPTRQGFCPADGPTRQGFCPADGPTRQGFCPADGPTRQGGASARVSPAAAASAGPPERPRRGRRVRPAGRPWCGP
jgi:hypothetical protein